MLAISFNDINKVVTDSTLPKAVQASQAATAGPGFFYRTVVVCKIADLSSFVEMIVVQKQVSSGVSARKTDSFILLASTLILGKARVCLLQSTVAVDKKPSSKEVLDVMLAAFQNKLC